MATVPSVIHTLPPVSPARVINHYFDTFHIVTRLEAAGFQHGQAVAMMKSIRALLVSSTDTTRTEMLTKSDLENSLYLYRAAMSELRTEVQTMRRKDSVQLRLDAMQLQRQLDALDQKMREDLQTMRTEVEMEIEMRRSQTRSDAKDIELRIQELDNKFTVKLGELRTAMERYKWDATRRLLLALVGLAVIGTYLINRPRHSPPPEEPDAFISDDVHQARPGNTFVSLG